MACFDAATIVYAHPLFTYQAVALNLNINPSNDAIIRVKGQLVLLSLCALLTMTLERYLALVFTFFHEETRGKIIAIFCSCYFFLLLPFVLYYTNSSRTETQNFFNVIVLQRAPFVLMNCLNFKVYLVAKSLRKRIKIALGNLNDASVHRNVEVMKHSVSLKTVSTCFLVVVCTSLCFLPHLLFTIYRLTVPPQWRTKKLALVLHLWADTFQVVNSTLNCLIFFYKNSTLRRHGRAVLAKCCMKMTRRFEWRFNT